MNRFFGCSVLLLALLATVVDADCRKVVTFRNRAVVVNQQVLAVGVPVLVPVYAVTYADPSLGFAEQIEGLRAEIRGLKAPGKAKEAPASDDEPDDTAMLILRSNCARCHDRPVSKTKGGGFVMLDGPKLADLTERQISKILSQVMSGKMPKDKTIDPEHAKIIGEAFDSD